MIVEIVPAALAGERLDRIVSFVADISRSHAAAMIAAGGVRRRRRSGARAASSGWSRASRSTSTRRRPASLAAGRRSGGRVRGRPRGRRGDRRRQAGGARRPPRRRQHGGHARQRAARPLPRHRRRRRADRPGIVHRLDAGQLGPAGRRAHAARGRSPRRPVRVARRRRSCGRRYVALVWGHPEAPHGIIDAPIGRDRRDPLRMAVVADGRPARTEYRLVERFDGAGRAGPARLPARDRPHPPDPGPPRARSATRSSATRPTASGARRSASSARSCTPPSWRSTTR